MSASHSERASGTIDHSTSFVRAISLLAALEADTRHVAHQRVLPYLGMARAELTDFGQRRPAHFVTVDVCDLRSGLRDLEQQLAVMQATSQDLQHTLRLDAARRLLARGVADLA